MHYRSIIVCSSTTINGTRFTHNGISICFRKYTHVNINTSLAQEMQISTSSVQSYNATGPLIDTWPGNVLEGFDKERNLHNMIRLRPHGNISQVQDWNRVGLLYRPRGVTSSLHMSPRLNIWHWCMITRLCLSVTNYT